MPDKPRQRCQLNRGRGLYSIWCFVYYDYLPALSY